MADTIQFHRGNKETMPVLPDGAPGWCRDEKALYIGHPDGNQKVGDAATFQRLTDLETAMGTKLTATPVEAQAALEDTAELGAVIGAINALVAAMQASGIMAQPAEEEPEQPPEEEPPVEEPEPETQE